MYFRANLQKNFNVRNILGLFFCNMHKKSPGSRFRGFLESGRQSWLGFRCRFVGVFHHNVTCSLVMLLVNDFDYCIVYQRFRPEEEFAVSVGDARSVGERQLKFNCSHFLKMFNKVV